MNERDDRMKGRVSEQYADKIIDIFEASKQHCKEVLALVSLRFRRAHRSPVLYN